MCNYDYNCNKDSDFTVLMIITIVFETETIMYLVLQ